MKVLQGQVGSQRTKTTRDMDRGAGSVKEAQGNRGTSYHCSGDILQLEI